MTSDYPNDDMRSSEPLNLPDPSRQAAQGDRPDTPTGQPLPPLRIDASLDPDPWHGDAEVEIDLPAAPPPVAATTDNPPSESPASAAETQVTDAETQFTAADPTLASCDLAHSVGSDPAHPVGSDPAGSDPAHSMGTHPDPSMDPDPDHPAGTDPADPAGYAPSHPSSAAEEIGPASPAQTSLAGDEHPPEPPEASSESPLESAPEPQAEEQLEPDLAEQPEDASPIAFNPIAFDTSDTRPEAIATRIQSLLQQEQDLKTNILALQTERAQLLESQLVQAQGTIGRMIQDGMAEMEQRRQALQVDLEQLERRRDRIRKEMRTTFAGSSQSLAVRVQGFKDYLVGSLQELVTAAEDLQLVREAPAPAPSPVPEEPKPTRAPQPQFAAGQFTDEARTIQKLIDRYRNRPDYYGPPWRLRRTFEPIHAERVSSWFFDQGGRGALRTLGSRLQNILVVSATASVLRALYGDRLRLLVAIDSPERLGEWRRGLQDCLGISRADFGGPNPGVMLFESSEPLVQKAERLVRQGNLPFIAIDEAEGKVSLALLQFPLWLAFAPDPRVSNTYDSFL